MAFEAQLTTPSLFRKTLESCHDIVDDANIDCNESGLSLQAMDASHVALVYLTLNASGFDKYICTEAKNLGVNLGSILKILKCGDAADKLTLKTNVENSELKFTFENETSGRVFEYSMSLMDIEADRLSIPEQEPDARIILPASEFQRICRDLTQFGDSVKLSVSKSSISFGVTSASGNGVIVLSNNSSAEGDSQVSIKCQENIELSFALRFLTSFTKATSLSDNVILELSSERPLVVIYELAACCVAHGNTEVRTWCSLYLQVCHLVWLYQLFRHV